ncbi:hypothetical protein VTK56DRAFT_6123 [Thermocarpiscus australiensis]
MPHDPKVATCLAHLKLLFAIQCMKEEVGLTDGLWGLWDARAGPLSPSTDKLGPELSVQQRMEDKTLEALSRIREKRWALCVARAVDRYETWWKSLCGRPLTEQDMDMPGSVAYSKFPTDPNVVIAWGEDMLPPLDAMLAGLRHFWTTGMPWHRVNKAIDTNFTYSVSSECKARWVSQTGLSWNNTDDPLSKTIRCPRCDTHFQIPWTTCARPEDYQGNEPLDLTGNGYGDGNLQHPCPICRTVIRKELPSVAKFVRDTKALLGPRNRPMPGRLLDPNSGTPEHRDPVSPEKRVLPGTFPNRLLKSGCNSIRTRMTQFLTSNRGWDPTMEDVLWGNRTGGWNTTARIAVRKMMPRYWENYSLFALDLCGAVMRQGIFVEKMSKLDWLHSLTARDTMARLLTKYDRFFDIIGANPRRMAPEDILSKPFEWTSKEYQERYGEVYSECTCWYCEAIRSADINPVGQALGMSKHEKIAETLHTSTFRPPSSSSPSSTSSSSAHISSHHAFLKTFNTSLTITTTTTTTRRRLLARLAARHKARLDTAHARACARAHKRGRVPPERQDTYHDHWGYPHACAAPWWWWWWLWRRLRWWVAAVRLPRLVRAILSVLDPVSSYTAFDIVQAQLPEVEGATAKTAAIV